MNSILIRFLIKRSEPLLVGSSIDFLRLIQYVTYDGITKVGIHFCYYLYWQREKAKEDINKEKRKLLRCTKVIGDIPLWPFLRKRKES